MRRVLCVALLAAVGGGCASTGSELSIPEKKAPEAFAGAAAGDGASAAGISWRDWLGDSQLEALITEALANNQDLQIALQRIEITRATAENATGALIPQVALTLGSGVTKPGRYTSVGAGDAATEITPGRRVPVPEVNYAAGVVASWEIDLWGKLRNQRQAALAQYLASIEGTNLVVTSLVADVASTYFELLALDHLREVLRQSVARQEEAVAVVRLQKEAGRANALAVQQFEGQLAETRALEREAARESGEVENALNLLLGRYPRPIARSKDVLFAGPANVSPGLPGELLRNRPDVREAELELRASRFDVAAARAAFFPNLELNARAGLEAFNPAYLLRAPESIAYSVTGGLLTPLFNWRALEAQFAWAKANQLRALHGYQRAVLVAYVDVVNALSRIRHVDEILALKKAQKASMVETVSTADVLYRAGKASYLEVLMAQQSALRAELDLIDAWKRRRVSDVVLYKALGGGWR